MSFVRTSGLSHELPAEQFPSDLVERRERDAAFECATEHRGVREHRRRIGNNVIHRDDPADYYGGNRDRVIIDDADLAVQCIVHVTPRCDSRKAAKRRKRCLFRPGKPGYRPRRSNAIQGCGRTLAGRKYPCSNRRRRSWHGSLKGQHLLASERAERDSVRISGRLSYHNTVDLMITVVGWPEH